MQLYNPELYKLVKSQLNPVGEEIEVCSSCFKL